MSKDYTGQTVTEAIKYRQLGKISYEDNLKLLKSDLTNGLNHFFGDHSKCSQYFRHGSKQGIDLIFFYLVQYIYYIFSIYIILKPSHLNSASKILLI